MRPAGPRHPPGPVPLWPIVNPGTDRGIPDSRIAREIPISFFLYPPLIIISDCKLIQSMPLLPLQPFFGMDPSINITKQKGEIYTSATAVRRPPLSGWPGLHCDFTGD